MIIEKEKCKIEIKNVMETLYELIRKNDKTPKLNEFLIEEKQKQPITTIKIDKKKTFELKDNTKSESESDESDDSDENIKKLTTTMLKNNGFKIKQTFSVFRFGNYRN